VSGVRRLASAEIHVVAPAKINLTLEVVARLPNGYHRIRSVILRLRRLADTLRLRIDDDGDAIRIASSSTAIPADERNLCHRAARGYLDRAGRTASIAIDIEKRIPVAAGLGGGSSDAAAVLLALNRHFGNPIGLRELADIGAGIGKDVPFFLSGDAALLATSMGEALSRVPPFRVPALLLVNPGIDVPTRDAYAALGSALWFMDADQRANRSQAMLRAMRDGDAARIAGALYNDFELAIERMHPVIKELKQVLLAFGARGALMSGSGSTVFGLFASAKSLDAAESALKSHYPSFFVARG
jgi:4-diphosphocytidyl-2-C-methyl-D-erythritol kinase